MRIMITGDSHAAALKLGVDMLMNQGGLPLDYKIVVKQLGNGNSLTAPFFIDKGDFAEMLNKDGRRTKRLPCADENGEYNYYGICAPLNTGRIWRNKTYWSKYTPFIPQGEQFPISTNLLRHIVLQDQFYIMQLIELLKRVGTNIFVIEAPKIFKKQPTLEQVNPKIISYVDDFYRTTMSQWLDSKAIPIINVPRNCYDAEGFMNDKFKSYNPTDRFHGNKEFGEVMIKKIINFVENQC